jgi:hypothetical protein
LRISIHVAHRCGERAIAEIDDRPLDDGSIRVDDYAQASALMKEGQPVAPRILVHATLARAGDLSLAHHGVNQRGCNLQALGDNRCLDMYDAILNLDFVHRQDLLQIGVEGYTVSLAQLLGRSIAKSIAFRPTAVGAELSVTEF